jgi:hypothetical protein
MKEEALACTLENSLWKRLRACRKTQQAVNEQLRYMALIIFHHTVNAFAHTGTISLLQFKCFIVPMLQLPVKRLCMRRHIAPL